MKIEMLSLIWNGQILISYTCHKNYSSPFYVSTWKDFYNKLETFLDEGKEPFISGITNKHHNSPYPELYEYYYVRVADSVGLKNLKRRLWHRFGNRIVVIYEDNKMKIKFNPKSAILLGQV